MSMRIITPVSPNQALYEGLFHLSFFGERSPSRNGDVVVSKSPVITEWRNPMNRVLVGPTRNANPFFHIVEAMWMLAGRNDLKILTPFNKRFAEYSDDGGITQPGAYGYRWRYYFGYDQIALLVAELKANPSTRRAVLTMWDGGGLRDADTNPATIVPEQNNGDLSRAIGGSKDVPCNTVCYFDMLEGRLNMTVACRSNDILWGAYGANVVHFSFLLEYVAACTGLPMGVLRQFSNNYHIYTDVIPFDDFRTYAQAVLNECVYTGGADPAWSVNKYLKNKALRQVPLLGENETPEMLDKDIAALMMDLESGEQRHIYATYFFCAVVAPMLAAWRIWKQGDTRAALDKCGEIKADDWQAAATAFFAKRMEA